jgi:hypothetical protein
MGGEVVWTVSESSPAGETLVGVYTSVEKARGAVSALGHGRLEHYRIEGHALDGQRNAETPWQVTLARDGEHLDTTPFIGCACSDDEAEYYKHSFIPAGGEQMSVIVFAPTPGLAIATAQEYRAWLQEQGHWSERLQPLQPLQALAREAAV